MHETTFCEGRAVGNAPISRETFAESIRLFELALALDPQSAEAQSRLAQRLSVRVLEGLTDTKDADLTRAEALVAQALATSPHDPEAHYAKGQLLRAQRRCAEFIPEYELALAVNRNWAYALSHIGGCKTNLGLFDEAIALQQQAIRLSPRDPNIRNFYARIGVAHLLQSHIHEAIIWLEKSRNANPAIPNTRYFLASAYALNGDLDRAATELAEARRLSGNSSGNFSSIARVRATSGFPSTPAIRNLYETTYLAGLRKTGMPEE